MNDIDIRVRVSFKDHRKRRRLEAQLGPAGVVALLDLWLTTAESHPDGTLYGYTAADLELDANWAGPPGAFEAAVTDPRCPWVDRLPDGYRIHDWEEHQPWVVGSAERSARNRALAIRRWAKRRALEAAPGAPPKEAAGPGMPVALPVAQPPAMPVAMPPTLPYPTHKSPPAPTVPPQPGPKSPKSPKGPGPRKFVPPTLPEVTEYCRSRENAVDPEAFTSFYESKGWKVGNQPMKDWRAAVRTWERSGSRGDRSLAVGQVIPAAPAPEAGAWKRPGGQDRRAVE